MKQVLIINSDIKMSKGKIASQAAHASVLSFFDADIDSVKEWRHNGMTKIVLKASGDTLMLLQREAEGLGLSAVLVHDAGHTEVEPGTLTALGIGPGDEDLIDKLVNGLKLL